MEIVNTFESDVKSSKFEDHKLLLEQIERIEEASKKSFTYDFEKDLEVLSEESSALRNKVNSEYLSLINRTESIKLSKVIRASRGRVLFDSLCMRLDLNRKYAELLPQWKDLADSLRIEELKTNWVSVCVRPKEGLTRAILEMYALDGGSLGDVLKALYTLECFDILELIKPLVVDFLNSPEEIENITQPFSLLATLNLVFSALDPCYELSKFSNGLKKSSRIVGESETFSHKVISAGNGLLNDDGISSMDLPLSPRTWNDEKYQGIRIKVLLLFSQDGIEYSEMLFNLAQDFGDEFCKIEVFRMNEVSLWYELLVNPEACCQKWSQEADYILPILTPKLLQEFHGSRDEANNEGFTPTSPILNKYMYTLIRARFTEDGCRNTLVRPFVPLEYLNTLSKCNAVKYDPLLRHVWAPLKEERVKARLTGMIEKIKSTNFQ